MCSILFLILSKWQTLNSGDTYLRSLGKFSSFVTTKCFSTFLSLLVSFLTLCYSSKLLLTFYLVFLTFLMRYFLLTQSNCVVLNLNILLYIFLLILFFTRRYTNFQKRLNSFMCFYGFLLCKILEILQYFPYTKIYEAMENVGIALFCRICVFTAIITMRLLILEIFCLDESLISIFYFLCKAIVPVYYSFIMLLTLHLVFNIVYPKILRFLFYLAVLYLLSVFLTSNMSCIGSAFDVNVSCIVNDNFNDFRSFLTFSINSVVNVDVHVNVDNYLNHKFYDHNFQSKPDSNSNNFKPEILFSVFTLILYHIFLKYSRELRIKIF